VAETLASLVAEAAGALSEAGFDEPRRQARRLIGSALTVSPADLVGYPCRAVDERQIARIRAFLRRMIDGEPLSRILGRREFWGLEFVLSADTLDPRPETETLVEAVLRRFPDRQAPLCFLDLGTGTGCLLLAILNEFSAASGFGIDIAEGAVSIATRNAVRLGLADRAIFFVGNWATAVNGKFDAIVANPPYIAGGDLALLPRGVARHDPRRALDGGPDGFAAYRAISANLSMLLASDGIFLTEVGIDRAGAVAAIMTAKGLALDGIDRDLAGIARCVAVRQAG
jgi:release factor glutamine methyltransferase